eukprot:1157723-Pelagomonas_calceolata.AAC.7
MLQHALALCVRVCHGQPHIALPSLVQQDAACPRPACTCVTGGASTCVAGGASTCVTGGAGTCVKGGAARV